ncbi:MAG: hypothetical protein RL338_672 [Chloroflexota bacterium]
MSEFHDQTPASVPAAAPAPDPAPELRLRSAVIAAALVVVAEIAVSAWGWSRIPEGALVPIHWGIDGRADGFAPKEVGLLVAPAITALLAVLLAVVPRFEPRRANLARSGRAYRTVIVGIVALLGILHAAAVLAAVDPTIDVARVVATGIGLLFAVIGNQLGKVRSNFMFGIRTPWTLASDRSWDRTHRLAGRLWVAVGLALAALALAGAPGTLLFTALLGGLLLSTAVSVIYSYKTWAEDPARRTTSG